MNVHTSTQHGGDTRQHRHEESRLVARVRTCVAHVLRVAPDRVTPDAVLLDLGAQSLEFMELVFRLEHVFDVELPRSYQTPDAYTVESYVKAVADALALAGRQA